MTPAFKRTVLGALLAGGLLVAEAPGVFALELFGIRLWGSDEAAEDRIEVIDPLTYTTSVSVSGEGDLTGLVENASALFGQQDQPAAGKGGLLSRARGDYRRILAALYGAGYYGASISITANGAEVSDLTLAADLPAPVNVVIRVDPGQEFRFGRADIENAPPRPTDPAELDVVPPVESVGFERGAPARAGVIESASRLSVERWRQLSHAKAREAERELLAIHETGRLDVALTLDPGPPVRYGDITTEGATRLDPEFILYMADLDPGGVFDPAEIEQARDRLVALGVFDSVRITEADSLGPGDTLPLVVTVGERERRTIGFGGTYSTLDGLGLSAYWIHRNMFGRAERLRFDASIERLLTTTDWTQYNYSVGAVLTFPGIPNPETNLVMAALARQADFENYREQSFTVRGGLSSRINERLQYDIFALGQIARFEDDFGTREFATIGLAGTLQYDRRDDPLDATSGYFVALDAAPSYEFRFGNPAILGTLEGRGFLGFGEESRFVLAGRAKIGAFVGGPIEETAPDQLFFAGGGGSIRGYAFRSIGVDYDNDGEIITVGGEGLLEVSGEVRARITETIGAVGFVDAGIVSADATFSSTEDVKVGVGVGARYYTGFGPLRFDLAFPLEPGPEDSDFGIYIGIGQAF